MNKQQQLKIDRNIVLAWVDLNSVLLFVLHFSYFLPLFNKRKNHLRWAFTKSDNCQKVIMWLLRYLFILFLWLRFKKRNIKMSIPWQQSRGWPKSSGYNLLVTGGQPKNLVPHDAHWATESQQEKTERARQWSKLTQAKYRADGK